MANMSRRSLLSIAPIASIALALPLAPPTAAEAAPAETAMTVDWAILSPATQSMILADYWQALTPDQQRTACQQLRAKGMTELADHLMPEYTGPGIYEFKLLDAIERTGHQVRPVAFLELSKRRSGFFRWQHYWNGKFEGRAHLVPASRIQIVSKKRALA